MQNNLAKLQASSILRTIYKEANLDAASQQPQEDSQYSSSSKFEKHTPEHMLLSKSSGRIIAKRLEIPAVEVEIERAVWQVERAIKAQRELREEKKS